MTSVEYWKRRSLEDWSHTINATEDYINTETKAIYKEASDLIQKDINAFYEKYAKDGKLSLQEAKRTINAIDTSTFNFNDETNELLKAAKIKGRINRLELLDMQVQGRLAQLADTENITLYEHLFKTYTDGYYMSLYNVGKAGFKASFALINTRAINAAILSPWSGSSFSERIWGRADQTFKEMKKIITTGMIRGTGIDKISRDLQRQLQVSESDARRIARTETNYAFNSGAIDGYRASGIAEKYRYLATLDFRTSEVCRSLDNTIHRLDDAAVGTNYPPMHPNCRSTVTVWFDGGDPGTRSAKIDGVYYKAPGDMSYEEWRASLPIETNAAMDKDLKMLSRESSDKRQYKAYKETIGKSAPRSFAEFQRIKYNDGSAYVTLKDQYRYLNKYPDSDIKYYNINKAIQEEKRQGNISKNIGTAVKPDAIRIQGVSDHAKQRLTERGINNNTAQAYVNKADIMFVQNKGAKRAYYSKAGAAVVAVKDAQLVTAYSSAYYDNGTHKIMELVKNGMPSD